MANSTVTINMKVLLSQIEPEVERRTINIAREMAQEILEENKDSFLESFENDPVSQELLEENNIFQSDYITGGGSHGGNLYSFFGFYIDEENPVTKLIDYLRENITVSTKTKLRDGVYKFKVTSPSQSDIENETQLPWIARSWIKAVENGLSNIKHYIRILDGSEFSRSEEGLQIKNTLNKSFKNKRYYFTERYKALFNKLGK